MKRVAASLTLLAFGLGACVQYAPAPVHPEAFVASFDKRSSFRPSAGPWTKTGLLQLAINQNPQVAEARAKYAVALAAARTAKTPPGSALTLTAEYANEAPHWGYSGAGDIPLDYGTRRSVRVTTANLQALQAYYDLGEAVWSVRTDLERALVDLLAAREELHLAYEDAQVRRARAALIETRVRDGQDTRATALTAEGESRAADARVSAAQGHRSAAEAALGKALGLSASAAAGVTPTTGLEAAPWAGSYDIFHWRTEAAQSRRDVLRAVADYDIAENALRLEVANQYPQVSLGPAYNYDHGVTKLPFSLALALPPVDLNRRAIAQAEAARLAAGRSLELAIANVLSAVDAAAAAQEAADQAHRQAQGDLTLAMRTETTVQFAVDAGEADQVDRLGARAAALEAALAVADAQHALNLAGVDLEDALRRAFDPAETEVIQAAIAQAKAAGTEGGKR